MKSRDKFVIGSLGALALVVGGLAVAQEAPNSNSGPTVARPRNKNADPNAPAADTTPDQPKIPSKFSKKDKPETEGLASFKTDIDMVTVDVAVIDNKGHFIPGIPRGNFRLLEDNVPQQVKSFSMGEAPMTVCMVIEFSNRYQQYWSEAWYQTLTASYGFLQTLKKDDYVAIVAYDMRSEILSDFSTDRQKAMEAMQRLRIAAFSEANLYDALTDTAERMKDLEG